MEFTGFREESFAFFRELRLNNSLEWYGEHEDDFQLYVRTPFDQLLRELDVPMREIDGVFALSENLEDHYSQMQSAAPPPGLIQRAARWKNAGLSNRCSVHSTLHR